MFQPVQNIEVKRHLLQRTAGNAAHESADWQTILKPRNDDGGTIAVQIQLAFSQRHIASFKATSGKGAFKPSPVPAGFVGEDGDLV